MLTDQQILRLQSKTVFEDAYSRRHDRMELLMKWIVVKRGYCAVIKSLMMFLGSEYKAKEYEPKKFELYYKGELLGILTDGTYGEEIDLSEIVFLSLEVTGHTKHQLLGNVSVHYSIDLFDIINHEFEEKEKLGISTDDIYELIDQMVVIMRREYKRVYGKDK